MGCSGIVQRLDRRIPEPGLRMAGKLHSSRALGQSVSRDHRQNE